MGDVLDLPDHAAGRAGLAFDLVASKLRRPQPRPGTVPRAVLDRLVEDRLRPLVSVVAPAGYGKTTLLAEWAERDRRPFGWLSVDERDNDPQVFLSYIAAALDRVAAVDRRVFDALASSAMSVSGSAVPRLASSFAATRSPVVLVVDDVHLLHNRECRSALSVLAENVPAGSRLVLAGRDAPPLRIARLRAEGAITEIGLAELSLTLREAAALLQAADVRLDAADVTRLHRRTEGWPVGLYLAALYVREGGAVGDAAATFGGDDRLVSEYMESELLNRISGPHRTFLTRCAALTSMTGALCEAALGLPGAAATLADLARSNMLFVPLDRRRQWYRYHRLFGDMLRAELERREPGVMAAVRRRAAQWCLENEQPEEAVEYAIGAQDTELAARLVEQLGFGVYWHGRRDRLDRWIRWLEERDAIKAHPMIAVIAGFLCLSTVRVPEAARWAGLLDRWQYSEAGWAGDRGTEAFAAMLRASVCRYGADQMAADVDEAVEKFAAEGIETPNLIVYRGLVCILRGQVDTADALFEDAISESEANDLQEILACALYERSLLAMARGDWPAAEGFADRLQAAVKRPGAEEVFVWIVRARVAAHNRELPTAHNALAHAQPLRSLIPMPVFAVQNRIELARAYLALNDINGARTVMRETDEITRRRRHLGTLVRDADAMRSLLGKGDTSEAIGPSALTSAELRLLPMLATHLTYPEIADELFLSKHTIHAQVKSMYRKLGATSRSEAVARSKDLALLE